MYQNVEEGPTYQTNMPGIFISSYNNFTDKEQNG